METKYSTFISHSNRDEEQVARIQKHLEDAGFSCFVSGRDLKHNAGWQVQLVDALEASETLLYVHSQNSNASEEVAREITLFADKIKRPIIIYRLTDDEYNKDKIYYLQAINYIDSLGDCTLGLDALTDNLKNAIDGVKQFKTQDYIRSENRRLFRKAGILAAILAVIALLGGLYYGIKESTRNRKIACLSAQCQAIIGQIDEYIKIEDSLDLVYPLLDKAESIDGQIRDLSGGQSGSGVDLTRKREECGADLKEIRSGLIKTVLLNYDLLQFMDRNERQDATEGISRNIGRIEALDTILSLDHDTEIDKIKEKI